MCLPPVRRVAARHPNPAVIHGGGCATIGARARGCTRAQEIARVIASQPAAAVQGTVKAMWQSLDVTRSQALATALMYVQVGNPLGTADLDRAAAKPTEVWQR
jgi:hypothetical protein